MKSNIPLTAGFGNKVFVHGRGWVKRDETGKLQAQKSIPSRLTELEQVISRGKESFIEVGEALMEIRDKELYLEAGFTTFPEYYEKRFGFKKSHVYRLMEASETALALPPAKRPKTERESRKSKKIRAVSPMGERKPESVPDFDLNERLRKIHARIDQASGNRGFLDALEEWLDESGIL